MASIVQICNMALAHIGASTVVTSISPPDGSVEAGYCATFYDLARTELLEPGNWAFSLARADLAQTTNPSDYWAYAYALPSNCLSARRILAESTGITVFNQDTRVLTIDDRGGAQFDIEGQTLYTNTPDAQLLYVRDITDSGKFTPSFTAALSYLLAAYLAGPIVRGNEGARLGDAMRNRALALADLSLAAAANASHAETLLATSLQSVRA